VGDVIQVIEGAVSAQYESVCMITVVRYLCTGATTLTLHTDLVQMVQMVENRLWYVKEIEENELDETW
jgi:hypothetical protein